MPVYFGDIHGHASVSPCYWKDCPQCDPSAYFEYARWVSGLDFAALTEHDHALDTQSWSKICNATKARHVPGQFVTFLGYEWTNIRYGHQNVYFRDDDGPVIRSRTEDHWVSPSELWAALAPYRGRVMTVPHHVGVTQFPADWSFYNQDYQPLSEVTSLWGDFVQWEQGYTSRISNVLPSRYVQEALENGYHLGFLGGSDSHDCRPGQPTFGGRRKANYIPGQNLGHNPLAPPEVEFLSDDTCNYRGLTGIWAEELTRDALWESFWARRTFATTGARIQLKVMLGEHFMGECVEGLGDVLTINAVGTALIDRIAVYVNNEQVWMAEPASDRGLFTVDLRSHAHHSGFCYVFVQQHDGHRAWSSPIWWTSEVEAISHQPFIESLPVRWVAKGVDAKISSGTASDPYIHVMLKVLADNRIVLSLTIPTKQATQPISGNVTINGIERYRVRERGFATKKYGGDLWTINDASLMFYFPYNPARQSDSVLEVLMPVSRNPSVIDIVATGVATIRVSGDGSGRIEGNPVSMHVELRKGLTADDREKCARHILLPWPDSATGGPTGPDNGML
jgi:hypothetical protein